MKEKDYCYVRVNKEDVKRLLERNRGYRLDIFTDSTELIHDELMETGLENVKVKTLMKHLSEDKVEVFKQRFRGYMLVLLGAENYNILEHEVINKAIEDSMFMALTSLEKIK